jgi:hypothetical protein
MHDPRMPFFDIDKPRVAYGEDFVAETFRMMQHVHQAVKVNLCERKYKLISHTLLIYVLR